MKLFALLILSFLLLAHTAGAQHYSWFKGTWYGVAYFPEGPVTKRINVRLRITHVKANFFVAQLANMYPNDTTVRLERTIKGTLGNESITVTGGEETYLLDPRTRNIWKDCSGCEVTSKFTIKDSMLELRLATSGCGDECNGETLFQRDTASLETEEKQQLISFLHLPQNSNVAGVYGENKAATATVNSAIQLPATDKVVISKSIRATSIETALVKPPKDTARAAEIALRIEKKEHVSPSAVPVKDTIPEALQMRVTNLVHAYRVTSSRITVQLFDNAEIDGDVVTVYHNGELLVNHQTLTHKAISMTIDASVANPHHEFVMIADNLGLIAPNTALLRIIAGSQTFELEVSSDMENNAKISIDYSGE